MSIRHRRLASEYDFWISVCITPKSAEEKSRFSRSLPSQYKLPVVIFGQVLVGILKC
jgi:hypothetical protein